MHCALAAYALQNKMSLLFLLSSCCQRILWTAQYFVQTCMQLVSLTHLANCSVQPKGRSHSLGTGWVGMSQQTWARQVSVYCHTVCCKLPCPAQSAATLCPGCSLKTWISLTQPSLDQLGIVQDTRVRAEGNTTVNLGVVFADGNGRKLCCVCLTFFQKSVTS